MESKGAQATHKSKESPEEGEIVEDENNNTVLVQANSLATNEECFDLQADLLRLGWRKQFSKRENRPYYYNILNKQSVWSLKDINFSVTKSKCNSVSSCSSVASSQPYISPKINNEQMLRHSVHQSLLHKKISPQNSFFRNSPSTSLSPFDDFTINSPCSVLSQNNNSNLFSSPVYSDKQSIRSLLSSADEHYDLEDINPVKKRRYEIGNWNLRIKSDVVTYERPMSLMLPPNHEIELNRFDSFTIRLRDTFFNFINDSFLSSIDCVEPKFKSALELKLIYWIIETKLINFNHMTTEPLFIEATDFDANFDSFRSLVIRDLMEVLYLNDLNKKFKENARKQIGFNHKEDFISLAKNLFMNVAKDDSDKYIETVHGLTVENKENIDEQAKRLSYALCEDLIKYFKDKVETLFDTIIKTSIDISKSLNKDHRDIYDTDHKITIIEEPPEHKADKKIMCYPFLMCTPSPLLTGVIVKEENAYTSLKYEIEEFNIKTDYFLKLKDLYKLNCKDDGKRFLMIPRIWSLLKRYQLIFQNYDAAEESNDLKNRYLFYTLKPNVFSYLAERFQVTFELFTCPLLNYFPQFCSIFSDIDSYFGSRGSMFNFNPLSGSLVAVLPYSIAFIEKFLAKIETSFEMSNKGELLSFIVVVPLVENESLLLNKLTKSSYLRRHEVLQKFKHKFKSFNNYMFSHNTGECVFESSCDTFIGFYQNLAAYEKYHVDDFDINQLNVEFN